MSNVTNFIEQDVSIRRSLKRGFTNNRALAKYIQEKLLLNCGLDAIISAIRRYKFNEDNTEKVKLRYEVLSKAKISSRTQMASVLLKISPNLRSDISKLQTAIDFSKNHVLRILEVSQYIKIVLDQTNLPLINNFIKKEDIIATNENLGEISLIFNQEIKEIPGILASVSSEFTLKDISILDSVICESEYILIIKEDKLVTAIQALYEVSKWGNKVAKLE